MTGDAIPATVQALLGFVYGKAGSYGEIILPDTAARRKAVKAGLLRGRRMKTGHSKKYGLTEAGRRAVEEGPKGPALPA